MNRQGWSRWGLGLLTLSLVACVIYAVGRGAQRQSEAARGASSGPVVLKLAHVLDTNHPVHLGLVRLAERTEALSGGELRIELFPGGQLGSEPESIEQLQRGAIAIVKTSTAAMENFAPDYAVFGLPYLFQSEAHYWRVLEGPLGQELLGTAESKGIIGLCYMDSGSRSFYTRHRPILAPEDVRSVKLRVLQSRMAMDYISSLGGAPTPVPWGELYTALQAGMVDGAENNPPSLLSSRHYEVTKHFSLNEHTRIPDIIIVSAQVWQRLTPRQQGWLRAAAAEAVVYQRQLWQERTAAALATLEANGVTIYRPDRRPFMAATAAFRASFAGTRVGELAARIEAAGQAP